MVKMGLLKYSILVLCVVGAFAEKARFDNYRVYELFMENEQHLELMQQIEDFPDGYRFWEFPGEIGRKAEIVVPPHKFGEFSEMVEKFEFKSRVMINNLQEVIDNEQPMRRSKAVGDWTTYWTLDEIYEWFDSLIKEFPESVKDINIGKSYLGKEMRGVKVNIGGGDKKSVLFEATIHAREWISTATTTWMLNEILRSKDPEIMEMAKNYEWIVFPVTNPDGYAYTWEKDRSWRKTRRPSNLLCYGADPNRNWDYHFNEGGSSTNPCSDLYAGSAPFSEPEVKQLAAYIETIPRLSSYFAFHAYGQMMMFPWGWSKTNIADYQQLYDIGSKGVTALTAKYGTRYSLGSIANVIYIASGSSIDWVKGTLGTNVTFAYEFRDEGRNGFTLPATQIIENSIEVFASIVAILKESKLRGIA